ncbi:sensor histidine kinase [Mangrovibacterium sp.]|uniref:sensor histidine kinase n=1 Tax=Mangrovibacterium sp. TaxID=1961364 RepID=UPI003563C045
MNQSIKLKRGESITYIVLWAVILLVPVFISNTDYGFNWSKVVHEWIRFLPFLIIFLVHNYFIFPRFFIPKKRILYFSITLVLVLLPAFFTDFIGEFFSQFAADSFDLTPRGNMPPVRNGMPPMGNRMPPFPDEMPMRPDQPAQQPFHRLIIDNALVSILVVGFNAAIKVTVIWQAEEQKSKELEKEKLQTELAFLKNQVSPHFFMNTLNNIHALIDINAEDAKESVIKLSKLMRYLLYDSEAGKTTLAKEIEFVKSYVDLMKLRFTSKVSIRMSFPEKVANITIPPMLFTSLLENAFKHGISYQKESFVDIVMRTDQNDLFFSVKNSKKEAGNGLNEVGGIGLENLKKRLDLIYPNRYLLEQKENKDTFEIHIKLPING